MIRTAIAHLALIGCSGALLWHFTIIWLYGTTYAGEPNLIIRTLETILLAGLLALGLERIISTKRRRK